MKQPTQMRRRSTEAETGLRDAGLPDSLDGRWVEGPRGRLAVALRPETVESLKRSARPTHWLVPLDDVALVAAAASLPGEVLWLSLRQPAEVLGLLQDSLRGAWVDGRSLVVNLDGRVADSVLVPAPEEGWTLATCARVVADRWARGLVAPNAEVFVSLVQPQSTSKVAA